RRRLRRRRGATEATGPTGAGLLQRAAEALEIFLAHFERRPPRQVVERERPVGGADQSRDLEPEMLENPADLAVLAFGQGQLDPLVAAGAPFHVGVDPTVAHALDLDSVHQVLEPALRDLAVGPRAVRPRHAGGRQLELALEAAV